MRKREGRPPRGRGFPAKPGHTLTRGTEKNRVEAIEQRILNARVIPRPTEKEEKTE